MSSDDKKWLQYAYQLAIKAEQEDEVPVGAIVIKNDTIIGEGYNKKEQRFSAAGHAEMIALQQASIHEKNWRLLESTLIVTLEPCIMCLAACQQARVSKVLYGAKDPKGGAISLGYSIHSDSRLNHQFEVSYLQTSDCEDILKRFFQKRREK